MLLAHSAKPEKGIPAHSYAAHIGGTVARALRAAKAAGCFAAADSDLLLEVVHRAAEYHDLGKLDDENQAVLAGKKKARHLPIQHTDAGTAFLLTKDKSPPAALVRSHHIGLPDFIEEGNRDDAFFRDDSVRERVDKTVGQLSERHRQALPNLILATDAHKSLTGNRSIFFRMALSCLVDGDHSDTAIHYGEYPKCENHIDLKPVERLNALDHYVAQLKENDERSRLRDEMYTACRNLTIDENIASCDSPVGTGKTTAVMAHLLLQASKRNLRRVIVVLPFTNIITEAVGTYREALILPGENKRDVVAELHHRADFQDMQSRHLTALWKAPIIVTTAVAFFETLASNSPATLRRLHNLPGSAIFVDESHAALPPKLLPLAWHWMKILAREWGCYWVLASGSLNRFWQIPEFDEAQPSIPEITPPTLREKLLSYETARVRYRYHKQPLDENTLIDFVARLPGPRIVILNTVQSVAAAAQAYKGKFDRQSVEHLSTALCPKDRDETLKRVKLRLKDPSDVNWALFATSCVEAGVNLSFRTGIREIGSLVSLLQIAGRVNRQGRDQDAEVWSIVLAETGLFKPHPMLKDAAKILREYCETEVEITPSLCTQALKREIRLAGRFSDLLQKMEEQMRFPRVEKEFRVIASDTRVVVVDKDLVYRLEQYQPVSWQELQEKSVQIWGYRLEALKTPEVSSHPRLYKWNLEYDNFLGFMSGILKIESFTKFMPNAGIV